MSEIPTTTVQYFMAHAIAGLCVSQPSVMAEDLAKRALIIATAADDAYRRRAEILKSASTD